jgi:hypothetical protein
MVPTNALALNRNLHRHQLSVRRGIEDLLAVRAPAGKFAAAGRDLALAARTGKGPYVDLIAP